MARPTTRQGKHRQRTLFDHLEPRAPGAPVRHGATGNGGTGAGACVVSQIVTASDDHQDQRDARIPATIQSVATPAVLVAAWRRVKANRGAAGVDQQSIDEVESWLAKHADELVEQLREDRYAPEPVRGAKIPKPGGGVRQLGIPTVRDRLVQQMLVQVLAPWVEPFFSESNYGYRPGRGAHDALRQASEFVADGYTIAVDLDLEAFFDRVNHDVLMSLLARRIGCPIVLRLIRRFLEAGLMQGGVVSMRAEGTPQGGPLSPLLSNILLHECDVELDRRGHRFVRYADDLTVYVRTQRAGERVMASICRLLEGRLRLKVNRQKSAVAPAHERTLLGHVIGSGGALRVAPKSLDRCKERVRSITRRNRGVSFAQVIGDLRNFLPNWMRYFRHADCKGHLQRLDEWIRHRLRCYRLKQCKVGSGIRRFLGSLGVPPRRAWALAVSHAGWWRRAGSPPAQEGMTLAWLQAQGLPFLLDHYLALRQ